jgi:hypothetical protein
LYIAVKNALPTGNVNHLPKFFWEAYWGMGLKKDASLIAQVLEGWLYLIYLFLPCSFPTCPSQKASIEKMKQQMKNRMASL